MSGKVEHVIVLMLENRSFDHVLGFLDHPDPAFEGLKGDESNPDAAGNEIRVGRTGSPGFDPGPDHSHAGAMFQLFGRSDPPRPYEPNMQGFLRDYEEHGYRERGKRGLGPRIMSCLTPEDTPVLSTLAREFAVCDHWFCSVPGETWPNRNFAHAATSDGEVNIDKRFYGNRTIFQVLTENRRDWAIYHRGMAQAYVFPWLWDRPRRDRFREMQSLYAAIRNDKLPHYAFVEPKHFPPDSDSQHPENFEKWPDDFRAGERLVQTIYQALLANPRVWEKTLFVITYDEHGGFYDHVPPPSGDRFRDGRRHGSFEFDLLGVRVPAVLVSPWIPAGTLDRTVYDHSSIPATLRVLFGLEGEWLSPREEHAATFEGNLRLEAPRGPDQVPRFGIGVLDALGSAVGEAVPGTMEIPFERLDGFQQSLVELARDVERTIAAEEAGAGPTDGIPAAPGTSFGAIPGTVSTAEVYRVTEHVRRAAQPVTHLRTVDGRSLQDPSREEMEAAVGAVREAADPGANAWLADHRERSVTVYGDGRVVFLDPERDLSVEAADRSAAEALRLFGLLREGRVEEIERALGG